MARKITLCLVLALALAFSPEAVFAVPTKRDKKKSSSLKEKKSPTKTTESTQSSQKSKSKSKAISTSSSKKKSSSYRRRVTQSYEEDTPVSQPYTAGVAETKPLMRVIPQRDGRFLLEPLTPKKKVDPPTGPTSELDSKSNIAPGGRGYNLYEPWNFRELVLSLAKCYRGASYSRGASLQTSNATDCSGFVQFIYQGFKINLPRSSREQAQVGKVVTHDMDFSKLVPGDLLFFRRGGYSIGHAGIYLGEGKMIHASNYRNGVTVTDLRQGYYQYTFVVAKRVFEVNFPK